MEGNATDAAGARGPLAHEMRMRAVFAPLPRLPESVRLRPYRSPFAITSGG